MKDFDMLYRAYNRAYDSWLEGYLVMDNNKNYYIIPIKNVELILEYGTNLSEIKVDRNTIKKI